MISSLNNRLDSHDPFDLPTHFKVPVKHRGSATSDFPNFSQLARVQAFAALAGIITTLVLILNRKFTYDIGSCGDEPSQRGARSGLIPRCQKYLTHASFLTLISPLPFPTNSTLDRSPQRTTPFSSPAHHKHFHRASVFYLF